MCSSQDIEYFNQVPHQGKSLLSNLRINFTMNWSMEQPSYVDGIPRATAQVRGSTSMQTLTTAMGPLMIHGDPKCLHTLKSRPKNGALL